MIEKLEEKGYKIESPKEQKLLKVGHLEITYPIEYTGTYDQIEVPKGFRLPEMWELYFIMQNSKEIREWEKGEWLVFYARGDTYNLKNNTICVLFRDGNLSLGTGDWDLAYSNEYGRVIFIKGDLRWQKKK